MSAMSLTEVASLFQDSLNDLTTNDRWQIQNLTVVAGDHIEAAQEISKTLETHIRTTAPSRKLPSLYVLDSIVKNVGSPYTIYLGRNLYSIFMDAYTLVEGQVRRAMESMLKTWKQPISSMDPTPVFPAETTNGIENALMKARAVLQRGQPAPFRNTPPPPSQQHLYQNGFHMPTPSPFQQQPQYASTHMMSNPMGQPPPGHDLFQLQQDIKGLIASTQQEFARNVYDVGVQKRLQALLDLQNVVTSQQLPQEAIALIRAQVSSMSASTFRPPSVTPLPQYQPPHPPISVPAQTPFAPGALGALLAAAGKPNTPTLAVPMLALPLAPNIAPPQPQSQTPLGGSSLFEALRAAGLGSSQSPATPTLPAIPHSLLPLPSGATGPAQAPSAADLLRSLKGIPPLANIGTPQVTARKRARIPTQAELKTFRPELLASLYDAQPNQCSTCGRRFPGTEEGKASKAAHLDWHFRTNQRIAQASTQIQYRKLYMDETEWIKLPNFDPSSGIASDDEKSASAAGYGLVDGAAPHDASAQARERWIPAPQTDSGTNTKCPVCQETFTAVWHDKAQEWVWMDAVRVGPRVLHASCHDEISQGAAPARALESTNQEGERSATPETALGKRKADDVLASLRAKLTKGTTA